MASVCTWKLTPLLYNSVGLAIGIYSVCVVISPPRTDRNDLIGDSDSIVVVYFWNYVENDCLLIPCIILPPLPKLPWSADETEEEVLGATLLAGKGSL